MTIIFKTSDGRTVETTDKNVLISAAKNGEIGPDTVVTIDGAGINAGRIKELVFGSPAPAPEPPKPATPPKPYGTAAQNYCGYLKFTRPDLPYCDFKCYWRYIYVGLRRDVRKPCASYRIDRHNSRSSY